MDSRIRRRPVMLFASIAALIALIATFSPVAAQVAEESDPACENAAVEGGAEVPAEECEETPDPEPAPEPTEEPAPEPVEEAEPPADEAEPAESEATPPQKPSSPADEGEDEAVQKPATPGSKGASGAEGGEDRTQLQGAGPVGNVEPASAPFVYLGGQGTTEGLIELLEPVVERGMPLEKALLRVVGPFPVAGLSWWANDWHAHRCCPEPHLHKGLDMFAEEGTPLVAIADGIVTQKRIGAVSGLSVEIRDEEGVEYFYAHLSDFAEDLEAGQQVGVGEVVGYVGDTGNAKGTMPHLHLEVQPNGVSVPPIPFVEDWLEVAERKAARWVERVTGQAPTLPAPTTSPVSTAQLLEHPSFPSGGAVPVSLEALDRSASQGVSSMARDPASSLAPAVEAVPATRSWEAADPARVHLLSLGLLLAAAVATFLGAWMRRRPARSRRRRRGPEPVEPVAVVAAPLAPPAPDEALESGTSAGSDGRSRELVGVGSSTLLFLIGLVLLVGLRTRR